MAKCEVCGKTPSYGNNVSHSKVRSKRQWKANIQKVTILRDGKPQTMYVCARCLRTMNRA